MSSLKILNKLQNINRPILFTYQTSNKDKVHYTFSIKNFITKKFKIIDIGVTTIFAIINA